MTRKTLLVIYLVVCLSGCGVRVKHHWEFMGPDTWEATNGKYSEFSYRGTCWEAERMLKTLAHDANRGAVDWDLMSDAKYRDIVMQGRCEKAINEAKGENK